MVSSYAKKADGYWLGEQAARLGLRKEFAPHGDPLMAKQRDDLNKTEAQRRRDNDTNKNEKHHVKTQKPTTDAPAPALKPPPHMRGNVSSSPSLQLGPASSINPAQSDGLKAQRNAAFAKIASPNAQTDTSAQKPRLSQTYNRSAPSQSP